MSSETKFFCLIKIEHMSSETKISDGWGFFVVIIVIIIIIWVIVANNRTPDTHIHAKPLFDAKTNTLKIRLSKYGTKYAVVEEKFTEGPDVVSKGPGSIFDEIASFPNNKSSGTKTVQLPDGTDLLNTTVRVTNVLGKEDVVHPAFPPLFAGCLARCLLTEKRSACVERCSISGTT